MRDCLADEKLSYREDHGEFVATETRDEGATRRQASFVWRLPSARRRRRMAIGVVDFLEAIEVHDTFKLRGLA